GPEAWHVARHRRLAQGVRAGTHVRLRDARAADRCWARRSQREVSGPGRSAVVIGNRLDQLQVRRLIIVGQGAPTFLAGRDGHAAAAVAVTTEAREQIPNGSASLADSVGAGEKGVVGPWRLG